MTYKIWRTDSSNITYWALSPINCSLCGKELVGSSIHILDWTKTGLEESMIHPECSKKFKKNPLSVVPERKIIYVVDNRPPGSVLVVPRPPSVIARNRSEMTLDFLSMAHKPSNKTTDNTVHSYYQPSIEGASIGSEEARKLADEGLRMLDAARKASKEELAEMKKKELVMGNDTLLRSEEEALLLLQGLKRDSDRAISEHKKTLLESEVKPNDE